MVIRFLLCSLVFISCSGLSYKYYTFDLSDAGYVDGILKGAEQKDDLPMSLCKPLESDKAPCVVLFATEWSKARRDMIELRRRLSACERR